MRIALLAFVVLAAGCGGHAGADATAATPSLLPAAAPEHVDRDASPSVDLLTAPAVVDVAGRAITATALLNRDFMPTIGANDNRLIGGIRLNDGDVPASLRATDLWVIHGDESWHVASPEMQRSEHVVEAIGRDGPRWPVGDHADVAGRFVDAAGAAHLVCVHDVAIGRSD